MSLGSIIRRIIPTKSFQTCAIDVRSFRDAYTALQDARLEAELARLKTVIQIHLIDKQTDIKDIQHEAELLLMDIGVIHEIMSKRRTTKTQ